MTAQLLDGKATAAAIKTELTERIAVTLPAADADLVELHADWIKAEIDRAPVLASTGRPLGPGDILVLVRSRANLAPLLVARLFERKVRTAGLDRLVAYLVPEGAGPSGTNDEAAWGGSQTATD